MRTGIGDVVDVETRVRQKGRVVNVVEDVACRGIGREWIWQYWEFALRRREFEVLVVVISIPAVFGAFAQGLREALVQVEQVGPVLDVWKNHD